MLLQGSLSLDKSRSFKLDLCRALMLANILLNALNNKELKEFLEKYTNAKVPDESTIRKCYVTTLYEMILKNIRKEIGNNYIWFQLMRQQIAKEDI